MHLSDDKPQNQSLKGGLTWIRKRGFSLSSMEYLGQLILALHYLKNILEAPTTDQDPINNPNGASEM